MGCTNSIAKNIYYNHYDLIQCRDIKIRLINHYTKDALYTVLISIIIEYISICDNCSSSTIRSCLKTRSISDYAPVKHHFMRRLNIKLINYDKAIKHQINFKHNMCAECSVKCLTCSNRICIKCHEYDKDISTRVLKRYSYLPFIKQLICPSNMRWYVFICTYCLDNNYEEYDL